MKSKFGKKKQSGPETGKESGIKDLHDLALLEAREQVRCLSRAVESLRDAVYITDFDHSIIYANPAIEFVQGYKPEEVIGKKASDFFEGIPGNPPDLAGLIKKEARDGFWTGEFFNRKKDGAIFPVQLIVNTIVGKKGEVLGYIGISRDISDRKRADDELKQSKDFINLIFNSVGEGLSVIARDYTIISTNAFLCSLHNRTEEEIVGQKCYKIYRGLDEPCPDCNVKRTYEDGRSYHVDHNGVTKNGDSIYASIDTYPIFDQNGKIMYVVETIKDITERKRAEEALRRAEQEKTAILDSMSEIVVFQDIEQRMIWVNKVAGESVSLPPEQLVGRHCYEIWPKRSQPCVGCPVVKARETGKPQEAEITTPDGRVWFIRGYPIRDANGDIVGLVESALDITERKRIEKELLKTQKLESVGTLAGGIAHDFNNMLMAILGNILLSKLEVDPESKVFQSLSDAEVACGRAKNLTQQLLTFSKGGMPVKKTASISELLKDAVNFALHGSNIKCEFSLPDDTWAVEVDEGQIKQAIDNLVINADQAMPEGGTIEVGAENIILKAGDVPPLEKGKYIKIRVKDQGTGIPQEHMPKIFDPYFSTKKKGSGLGLTTAYSIIKNHDGMITAESELGAGTTFFVYLPASGKGFAKKKGPEKELISGKGRILLMDDEEIVRKVIGRMLKNIGFEVEFAHDGTEVVEIYRKAKKAGRPFAAVILDLTVPGGLGGKETLKKLIKIDPEIKAIVSSGYSTYPIMSDFEKNGFCGVITKPFKMKELSEVLSQVIKSNNSE